MKYKLAFLTLLTILFTINLNAQFFAGGNVRFNGGSDKDDEGAATTSKSSYYNLTFSPKAGKFLSEKVAVGIALNVSLAGNTSGVNTVNSSKSSTIGASPFLRYYAVKWNKLSVYGQGNIGFDFSGSSTKSGGTTNDGPKTSRLYLSCYPGLSYSVSEKFDLETSFSIFSFGYTNSTTKDGTSTNNNSSFNVGAGLDNMISVGAISIGAIYRF